MAWLTATALLGAREQPQVRSFLMSSGLGLGEGAGVPVVLPPPLSALLLPVLSALLLLLLLPLLPLLPALLLPVVVPSP
jgi:hypothetical protein